MKDFSHLPDLARCTLINSDGDTVDLDVAKSDITYVYSSNMYIAFSESIYYNANSIIILPVLIVSVIILVFDCITASTYMYRCYHAINRHLNNRYFIVLFILVEALIEYHHIVNGI